MAKKKAVKKAPAASGEKPMKKSTAVRAIMATGVKDIKEIQQQAKEKYGLEIAYQNVYTLLKAGGKSGGTKKSASRKAKTKSNVADSQLGALAAACSLSRPQVASSKLSRCSRPSRTSEASKLST